MLRIALGLAWATPMLLLGGWLWARPAGIIEPAAMLCDAPAARIGGLARGGAVVLIAGAQFVYLTLVADELCPAAPARLKKTLKGLACGVVWLALLVTFWGLWNLTRTSI
jgi:hypothetical protein